jgi:hypothetical protein
MATIDTLADLLDRLGGVPFDRIRLRPPPGTATVQDVIRIQQEEGKLCELVEGVLPGFTLPLSELFAELDRRG